MCPLPYKTRTPPPPKKKTTPPKNPKTNKQQQKQTQKTKHDRITTTAGQICRHPLGARSSPTTAATNTTTTTITTTDRIVHTMSRGTLFKTRSSSVGPP